MPGSLSSLELGFLLGHLLVILSYLKVVFFGTPLFLSKNICCILSVCDDFSILVDVIPSSIEMFWTNKSQGILVQIIGSDQQTNIPNSAKKYLAVLFLTLLEIVL